VPGRPSPPILLLPGAAERGKEDPRAVRLARSLARSGRLVFVPDLKLHDLRLSDEDLDRIVRAVVVLDAQPAATGDVQILGISYGGSFGLVASADPRVRGHLAQVSVFGAYWDLIGVIQAVTTGVSVVDGNPYRWPEHPRADEILEDVMVRLAPRGSRKALRSALAGSKAASSLSPEARAIHDLLANRDPARTEELASRLDPGDRGTLWRFSPASVASRIDVPVAAMHSVDDPAVPFGEAVRLAAALPEARMAQVRLFRHVDLEASSVPEVTAAMGDLVEAWRFATWVVAAQE
jgi:pimeloyl-ACP methyl ester carboxylesterase